MFTTYYFPTLPRFPSGAILISKGVHTFLEEKLLSAISTVGFPIVVSCYLLVKFQATLDRFSNKVDELILELRNGYYYMNPHNPHNAA